ncbi:MAG: FAD:protein FMN transferase [Leptolyngbya sp. SIO3F4]|nr:FAD:protein FMN transferase [Leptolyngbya sp. SIO3F4]
MKAAVSMALAAVLFAGCGSGNQPEKNKNTRQEVNVFSGEAQGTTYNIRYIGDYAPDALKSELDSILKDIDRSLSTWDPTSLITELNKADSGTTPFDDHYDYFTEVYKAARGVYTITDGAFDPTVGPLVEAWGFGLKNRENMTDAKVDSLIPLVGFTHENVRLSRTEEEGQGTPGRMLYKRLPGMQLDFNAIAQGYSVDVLGRYLESVGIQAYMVELGGEVLARGTKPEAQPWKIGIDKPEEQATERTLQATVQLQDLAIATSGNYRKFYVINGQKYAHTIDPKTGYPVKHGLLSATVVADVCWKADAYATAFMVMGVERSRAFLESEKNPGLEAYLIYSEGEAVRTYTTPGLANRMEELGN